MASEIPPSASGPDGDPGVIDPFGNGEDETGTGEQRVIGFPMTDDDLAALARHYVKKIRGLDWLCL